MQLPHQSRYQDSYAERDQRIGVALERLRRSAATGTELEVLIQQTCREGASPREICAALGMPRADVLHVLAGRSGGLVVRA